MEASAWSDEDYTKGKRRLELTGFNEINLVEAKVLEKILRIRSIGAKTQMRRSPAQRAHREEPKSVRSNGAHSAAQEGP